MQKDPSRYPASLAKIFGETSYLFVHLANANTYRRSEEKDNIIRRRASCARKAYDQEYIVAEPLVSQHT
jgi:hypothetical protein